MIRWATPDELAQIMATRSMVAPYAENTVIVEQDGCKMLAAYEFSGDGVEVHICISPKDAIRSRELAKELMQVYKGIGCKYIETSITAGHRKADNMAVKLGFKLVGCYNKRNFYRMDL